MTYDIEQKLLLSLLRDASKISKAISSLTEETIPSESGKWLYHGICEHFLKYGTVPTKTIIDVWLSNIENESQRQDHITYLKSTVSKDIVEKDFNFYLDSINNSKTYQDLLGVLENVSERINPDTVPEILTELEDSIFRLRPTTNQRKVEYYDVGENSRDRIMGFQDVDENEIGIPTPIKALNDAIGGLKRSQLNVIAAPSGGGKCLSGNTLLTLDDGSQVSIKEFVKIKHGKVLSMDENFKMVEVLPSDFLSNGIKPVFKVMTKNGREIVLTDNHPLFTIKGWTEVRNIKIGERIAVPRVIPFSGKKSVPLELIKLMGLWLGDGSKSGGFCNAEFSIIQEFRKSLSYFNNVKSRVEKRPGISVPWVYGVCPSSKVNKIGEFSPRIGYERISKLGNIHAVSPTTKRNRRKNEWCEYLESFGLLGITERERFIPSWVMTLNNSDLAVFLGRLWSTDGSIFSTGNSGLSTISKIMMKQVHHLLLRLGVLSTLGTRVMRVNGEKYEVYGISIHESPENLIKFHSTVGYNCVGKKRKVSISFLSKGKTKCWQKNDAILVGRLLREELINYRIKNNIKCIRNKSASWISDDKMVGRNKLITINKTLKSKKLSVLTESEILWDEIVSISSAGNEEVFDITIPKLHNFVANDIIVHNSVFLLNFAEHAYSLGKNVVYITIEMSYEDCIARYHSLISAMDAKRILNKTLSTEEKMVLYYRLLEHQTDQKSKAALKTIFKKSAVELGIVPNEDELKIYGKIAHTKSINRLFDMTKDLSFKPNKFMLVDSPFGVTIPQLRANLKNLSNKFRLDLVVVDYLNIMSSGVKNLKDWENGKFVSVSLKQLAREFHVPILTACQIHGGKPNVEDKLSQDDVRYSKAINENSDNVIAFRRSEKDEMLGIIRLELIKHRNSEFKSIAIREKFDRMSIEEICSNEH